MRGKISSYIDYHIHPGYSVDARGNVEEFTREAISKGLGKICFTTHVDLNPQRKVWDLYINLGGKYSRFNRENFSRYTEEVRRIARKYSSKIDVACGAELSYGRHFEDILLDFINGYDLDFIIGSVHCLGNVSITSSQEVFGYFRSHGLKELVQDYYSALYYCVDFGRFGAIGHLDCYKKYGLAYYGPQILTAHREFINPVLELMAQKGVGLEINTSARRKGHQEFYPSNEILEMAYRAGIKLASIGSDAHQPDQVGFLIPDAYELAQDIGFDLPGGIS
ncbi:histidinol-phosphatase [bacterium]|nr:histidinol-phosphatase [bacterium]